MPDPGRDGGGALISGARVVADESVNDLEQARQAIALDAVDAVTLKLAKVGGVNTATEIADSRPRVPLERTRQCGRDRRRGPCRTGVVRAGVRCRSCARARDLPTCSPTMSPTTTHLNGPILTLDDRPGLGLEVDEDAIERLRLR